MRENRTYAVPVSADEGSETVTISQKKTSKNCQILNRNGSRIRFERLLSREVKHEKMREHKINVRVYVLIVDVFSGSADIFPRFPVFQPRWNEFHDRREL